MRLLVFTEGPNHVCYRYRVAALAPALEERRWTITAQPLADDWRRRIGQFRAASAYDVVLVQRKLLPRWQTMLLRHAAPKLVYDFDDAVLFRDSFSSRGARSWVRAGRFRRLVRAADLVLAGNDFLASLARDCRPRGRVMRVPTVVDPARYRAAIHAGGSGPLRMVWIGQRSTTPYLERAAECLAAAARAVPALELHLVSDVFPSLPGVNVVPHAWSEAEEARLLAEADVGISWLTDDAWSRGKCGLKTLQYMAAGLPVVTNRVGVQSELVEHGSSGFLADTPQEWALRLAALAADPALRARMGAAGRMRVERDYSVRRWAPEWAEAIASLAAQERTSDRPARKAQRIDATAAEASRRPSWPAPGDKESAARPAR